MLTHPGNGSTELDSEMGSLGRVIPEGTEEGGEEERHLGRAIDGQAGEGSSCLGNSLSGVGCAGQMNLTGENGMLVKIPSLGFVLEAMGKKNQN